MYFTGLIASEIHLTALLLRDPKLYKFMYSLSATKQRHARHNGLFEIVMRAIIFSAFKKDSIEKRPPPMFVFTFLIAKQGNFSRNFT